MIIYNITTKVESSIAPQWLSWMLKEQVPDVLNTGCFTGYNAVQLLETDDSDGPTYAVQFSAPSMAAYNNYIEIHAPLLRRKSIDKWGGGFITFSSLMQVIDSK